MGEKFERIKKAASSVGAGIISPSVRTGMIASAVGGSIIGFGLGKAVEKNKPAITIEDAGEHLPDSIAALSSVIEDVYREYTAVYDRIVEAVNKGTEPNPEDIAESERLLKKAHDLEMVINLLRQFQSLKESETPEKAPAETQPKETTPEKAPESDERLGNMNA